MKRPIDRYVDSLLRRRRPAAFAPTEDDLAVARAAIDLAAAAPDAPRPREAFVEDLRRRIADRQDAPAPTPAPPAASRIRGRRRFLTASALTATGVAVGVAAESLVAGGASVATNAELTPTVGSWQNVISDADLPEGAVLPFDLGAVSGFVRRVSGRVQAVSGICTHQGCRLHLDTPGAKLAVPLPRRDFLPRGGAADASAGQLATARASPPAGPHRRRTGSGLRADAGLRALGSVAEAAPPSPAAPPRPSM